MTQLGDFFSASTQQKLHPLTTNSSFSDEKGTVFPIEMITTAEQLTACCNDLKRYPELALDLEFDDMRYYYGRTLSLIQVYNGETVFLIDAVALTDLTPLIQMLEDENMVKIFHSCGNDLMVLSELYSCRVRNIRDTSLLYRLLGHSENSISLKNLLKLYVDVDLEKGEQASNWITRPLTESQVLYAAKDVIYLHQVLHLLQLDLTALNRWEWVLEECKALEKIRFVTEAHPYLKLAQKNRIYPNLWPRFAAVWYFRENLAKKMNRPPYQLIPNDVLCELVRNPARTLEKWSNFKGIHSNLRKPDCLTKLTQLSSVEAPVPAVPYREMENRVRAFERSQVDYKCYLRNERKKLLRQVRDLLMPVYGLPLTNLLLSEKIMADLADLGTEKMLKKWQQQLVSATCEANNLDYSLLAFSLY